MIETKEVVAVDMEKAGLPIISIDEMKMVTNYVNQLKKALMVEGKDYIIRGDKQYTARSGYAKLAQGFNLSDEILEKEELFHKDGFYGWRFVIRVFNTVGRQSTGVGACTVDEPNMEKRNERPYHDAYAIAYTRAWNRAISNFVGSADVSVEEMGYDMGNQSTQTRKVEAEVKIISFMQPQGLTPPKWAPADELNRTEDAWGTGQHIVETWMTEAGLTNDAFEVKIDRAKITVVPRKALPSEIVGDVNGIMLGGGFLPTKVKKVDGWRLNKKDVTG